MVYTERYNGTDRRFIASGIAEKVPDRVSIIPYYADALLKESGLDEAEYLEKCRAEIHAFLAVLCRRIPNCGECFTIHEEGSTADIILNDSDVKLENLKKIMEILGEFPARWVWAQLYWKSEAIPGGAERLAKQIVEAYRGKYVHIGDRIGKLAINDQGEIILKKPSSKHYGFVVSPEDLCKEYLINHKHFKRGEGNGPTFADLSKISYWR